MEAFVQRLVAGRNRKGLTQTELAREMGVHLRSIQNWEGGITEPRGKDLRKLSTILQLSIPFLLGMDDLPQGLGPQSGGFWINEIGGEIRQRAHEHIDKIMDSCHGDRDQQSWYLIELKKRFPISSSGAAAVAGELLSGERASGSRQGRASGHSRGAGGPSARTSAPARGAGKHSSKKP